MDLNEILYTELL